MTGTLGARPVDVGGGVFMTGPVTLRYTAGGCSHRVGIQGTLARAVVQHGLHFAANTQISTGPFTPGSDSFARGTLDRDEVVDGLTVNGELMVRVTPAGKVQLFEGTLAKAGPFEQWQLPVGTKVQRYDAGWSFTTARGQTARATAVHRGERVEAVLSARSDGQSTTFTLARAHTVKGSTLALDNIGIIHRTGCVLGDVAAPRQLGIFKIPKGGAATLCGGTLVAAEGTYAVPSLQVGSWFATEAVAGDPKSPPGPQGSGPTSRTTAGSGYWIQINSLCQGASGIPQPPPKQRWIFVDAKGAAPNAADGKELASRASKRGTPCPVHQCCVP